MGEVALPARFAGLQKKRATSLQVREKLELPEPSPQRKKRCTLGTLAALAGQMVDEESDDEDLSMGSPSPSPSPLPLSVHSAPNSPKEPLRFGPKCGAPIWA